MKQYKSMKEKGLDKFITPNGFVDEYWVATVIGAGIVLVNWIRIQQTAGDIPYLQAMLIGLGSGHILLSLLQLSRSNSNGSVLRWIFWLGWPLSLLAILISGSRSVAFGFYSGVGIVFCFGSALSSFAKRSAQRPIAK